MSSSQDFGVSEVMEGSKHTKKNTNGQANKLILTCLIYKYLFTLIYILHNKFTYFTDFFKVSVSWFCQITISYSLLKYNNLNKLQNDRKTGKSNDYLKPFIKNPRHYSWL